jgi:hypothetical protein
MQGLRSFAFALAALLGVASIAQSTALACATARGKRVELTSQSLDPDVFVWDSMARLINYQSGKYVTDDVSRPRALMPSSSSAAIASSIRASRTASPTRLASGF